MLARKAVLAGALIAVALLPAFALSQAASKQIWACAAHGAEDEDLFLVAWGKQSYVKLYDARIWGNHYAEDGNLRWDFGKGNGGQVAYSAILKPDGEVDYYDFREVPPGEAVTASYHYRCRLAQS